MSDFGVERRVFLTFSLDGRDGRVELITKDIGATIGTQILDDEGSRLVAYRPGTRYGDRAEEIAAEHLTAALERIATVSSYFSPLRELLAQHLPGVVVADGCTAWNPDDEGDDW